MRLGICSWCTEAVEEPGLRQVLTRVGLPDGAVHLALGPLALMEPSQQAHAIAAFNASAMPISAGMVSFEGEDYTTLATIRATGGLVPDATAEKRMAHLIACGHVGHQLGLKQISTHAGFIPHAGEGSAFATLLTRLRAIADAYRPLGITLLFETGQETAGDLTAFLAALDRPNVGVNFDPANMVMYGKGDPAQAAGQLLPWIRHVHAKDAVARSPVPVDAVTWRGSEAPLGAGNAKLPEVIATLKKGGYGGTLAIERESGPDRAGDIIAGIAYLRSLTG